MTLLSLDELRRLPEAGPLDAGVYFLWVGDELQYIGKSTQVAYRMIRHIGIKRYMAVRRVKDKEVPWDRHTCLVLDNGIEITEKLRSDLLNVEREYIAAYQPPYNDLDGGGR